MPFELPSELMFDLPSELPKIWLAGLGPLDAFGAMVQYKLTVKIIDAIRADHIDAIELIKQVCEPYLPITAEQIVVYNHRKFGTCVSMENIINHPDNQWDWASMSSRSDYTIHDILRTLHKPWDWHSVSKSRNITFDHVMLHHHVPWSWSGISQNINVTFELVAAHDQFPWSWPNLSKNPNVTVAIVRKYIDKPWSWSDLSRTISFREIKHHLDLPWVWSCIEKDVTVFNIYKFSKYDWHPDILNHVIGIYDKFPVSFHDIMKFRDVLPGRLRPWKFMSGMDTIDMDVVLDNINEPWSWEAISQNPGVSFEYILGRLYLPWSWPHVCCNPNVTIAAAIQWPSLPWSWEALSKHPNCTCQDVFFAMNEPWDYDALQRNETIWLTDLIEQRRFIPWNWHTVMNNSFASERNFKVQTYTRQYMAAFRIQTAWRKISQDPTSEICQRVQARRIGTIFT